MTILRESNNLYPTPSLTKASDFLPFKTMCCRIPNVQERFKSYAKKVLWSEKNTHADLPSNVKSNYHRIEHPLRQNLTKSEVDHPTTKPVRVVNTPKRCIDHERPAVCFVENERELPLRRDSRNDEKGHRLHCPLAKLQFIQKLIFETFFTDTLFSPKKERTEMQPLTKQF